MTRPITLIICLLVSGCNSSDVPASKIQLSTYKNTTNHFALMYPGKWDTSHLDPEVVFKATEKDPLRHSSIPVNLMVLLTDMPDGVPLPLILNTVTDDFKKKYSGGHIIEQNFGENRFGVQYAFFKSLVPFNKLEIEYSNSYFHKGNKLFVLSLSNNQFDSTFYNELYTRVLNTFNFN